MITFKKIHCWCTGVLGCWSIGIFLFSDYFNNPIFQYSNIPKSNNATNLVKIKLFGLNL